MVRVFFIAVILSVASIAGADGAVWVYFTDRGLAGDQLAAALDRAESDLPARVAARRARVAAPGSRLVTAGDLPCSRAYLDAVLATGAAARQQSRWLNAASFDATEAQIARIAALPFVARVEPVRGFIRREPPAKSSADLPYDYALSLAELQQIAVPAVHEMGVIGQGIVIGMLDTGFKITHEAFEDLQVVAARDFVNGDDIVADEAGDPVGQHNHGTKVLSAIVGFKDGALVGPAFGASVILAKTEDASQEVPIEEDYWVAGLEWVESLGADIVSSSLGYSVWYTFSDLDGNTAVSTIVADLAVARGLCVVNAAGNEGPTGHIIAPADGDSVIAVGAVDLAGGHAYFSSPGPTYDGRIKPDVCALGDENPVVDPGDDHGYTTATGTSLACPLAAGVAALVLSRCPSLTPLQVREALRETASRAGSPDNEVGWGILNALAAVLYWGPQLVHAPLSDTEDVTNPYAVTATVTDRFPLQPGQLAIVYRANGGPWLSTPLAAAGGDLYTGAIGAQPAGTVVDYYLEVTDAAAVTTRDPLPAPAVLHTFAVGMDLTPPALAHDPLGDQPLGAWPPRLVATASDNLGIDRVEVTWSVNGGATQGPVAFAAAAADTYALDFPLAAGDVHAGDAVVYTIAAWDVALAPNVSVSGPHDFAVLDVPGVLLVIDDGGGERIAQWLQGAGYVADRALPAAVTPALLAAYQATVYAAGNNAAPLACATMREALITRARAGGKLLIEGGEVGAVALDVQGGFPDFARYVLHSRAWRTDNAGSLLPAEGQAWHPLLTYPYVLPPELPVAFTLASDQDACSPSLDAELVLSHAGWPTSAGLLLYDDDAIPQSAQIVYFACNAGALADTTARHLVENAVSFLLASEGPPTATIAGRIALIGTPDYSGVTVSAGGFTATTGFDGRFTLGPFHAGTYVLAAHRPGYVPRQRLVSVAHGQQLGGVDLTLQPAQEVHLTDAAQLAIPDPGSVARVVYVAPSGTCAGVSVDIAISHGQIGDLIVSLISPRGTLVRLHDRSGGDADDLVGNWPTSLAVDGPGRLDDLIGEETQGNWLLIVADAAAGNAGTLQSWGLNLVIPVSVPEEEGPPAVTALLGNAPNPFNPQTKITFDLARPGPVQLEIFDVSGRLVRRLINGPLEARGHEILWDSRDDGGREVASGMYLYRLRADSIERMRKMMLVR